MKIYNSLTQQKEDLSPMTPGKLGMYVCGMTVYDYCHLGHARVMLAFDVIARHLRFKGYELNYVRNITDVDDKILRRAAENKEPFPALTERMIAAMHEDERALGVLPPTSEPRATDHIEGMIDMIAKLVDTGYAYAPGNGDVYFAVSAFPDYGKLSKRKLEDLIAGARVEVGEIKNDPADFALWKSAPRNEDGWQSPWGWGRPGWHIECSVMSTKCLGDTFDIHGGGPDLKFPHHENEIAQSEAATGKPFVNVWMHAGAVRVNKEKMSKSLGNFFTIREILAKYPAEVIRYFLVSSHYRSQIDYSEENLAEARAALTRLYTALRDESWPLSVGEVDVGDYGVRYLAAMDDDFNTAEVMAVLFDVVREIHRARKESRPDDAHTLCKVLVQLGARLGLLQGDPSAFLQSDAIASSGLSADAIEALIVARTDAKKAKNWVEADRIRDHLRDNGIALDDGRAGTTWKKAE